MIASEAEVVVRRGVGWAADAKFNDVSVVQCCATSPIDASVSCLQSLNKSTTRA